MPTASFCKSRIKEGASSPNRVNEIIFVTTICFSLLIFTILPSRTHSAPPSDEKDRVRKTLRLDEKWSGDFDGMVDRRKIRVLVTPNKTHYFLDKARQRGATYEVVVKFETDINKKLKRRNLKVNVVFIPVPRDRLIPALIEGRGDIAAAGLTITPERKKHVDFSAPLITTIDEIVVTAKNSPKLSTLEDLSGKTVFVRKSSSYFESLTRLNATFENAGKPKITIREASEYLEDEDLLEMVNAGLIPATVSDNYLVNLWAKIFKDMVPNPDLALNIGGSIAWMIRKNSPKLKKEIDDFIKKHKKGSLFGNIIFNRYFKNTRWIRNAYTGEDLKRFKATIELFKKYGKKYDMDWLLVAACAYQESRIDQNMRSPVGAVGVMQLLPSTAAGHPVNIPDIEQIESNIHAGVKYLRWLFETYFKDEKMDLLNKGLFTFASYNAGPGRIRQLRRQAPQMGLDPNVWFNNVEIVAAKKIGRETVQYVSNIYKYYIAYRLIVDKLALKETANKKLKSN